MVKFCITLPHPVSKHQFHHQANDILHQPRHPVSMRILYQQAIDILHHVSSSCLNIFHQQTFDILITRSHLTCLYLSLTNQLYHASPVLDQVPTFFISGPRYFRFPSIDTSFIRNYCAIQPHPSTPSTQLAAWIYLLKFIAVNECIMLHLDPRYHHGNDVCAFPTPGWGRRVEYCH